MNTVFPRAVAWAGAVALLAAGCTSSESNATLRDFTGLDGCGMVLETDAGDILEPVNLLDFLDTPEDGMAVAVTYDEVPWFSICMVGPMVELSSCVLVP
jgi:hypothetical protein